MPHDMRGNTLRTGDIVTMRMRVKEVYPTDVACNVTLVAVDGPEGEYKPEVSCNTRLVQLDRAIEEERTLVLQAENEMAEGIRDAEVSDPMLDP